MTTNHSFLVEPVEAPTSDEQEKLLKKARAAQVAGTFPSDSAIRLLTDDYGWNESERRHCMAAARLALAYWGHAWGCLTTNQPAPAEPSTFALQWSENRPPCEECRYDHCTAETPFGSFLITWKSWKKYDYPTVDETPWGDSWQAFATVELAKAACQREFDTRLALCGLNRPAPAEPADMAVEQLQHIIHRKPWATWLRPGGCLESAHCELTDLLSSVIAADRARRAALPAEGELVDLADAVMSWAARLDEGTPEERLLGRVSAVLRQRQAPPNEGEVDALIKILSRIARMLDFMPDGPPEGLIIHRAIELLRQLAPPAEGEVGELVAWIYRQATHGPDGDKWRRTANLLQRQAAELAMLRHCSTHGQQPAPPAETVGAADGRNPYCVSRWPDCHAGEYDPRCCRFPKSCSCYPCLPAGERPNG